MREVDEKVAIERGAEGWIRRTKIGSHSHAFHVLSCREFHVNLVTHGGVALHSTLNATGAVSCHGLISLHSCH